MFVKEEVNRGLIKFIDESPCAVFAVDNVKDELEKSGFREYFENEKWDLNPGDKGYVVRNMSSIIAFTIPEEGMKKGFNIVAAHSDSPCFKIKEVPECKQDNYLKLNVEKYGGMIMHSWFDRPLSIAGRVVVKEDDALTQILVDIKRDLLVIPSVAIHMTRNNGTDKELNPQTDMLPLFGEVSEQESFYSLLSEYADTKEENILGADMYVYNRQRGTLLGMQDEFLSAPRLDDLQCVYAALIGMKQADKDNRISVMAVFDNEEVGSLTRQGADSDFLQAALKNIAEGLGKTDGDLRRAIADSFMISADNAHGVHPNHAEKADITNRPVLNQGIVIKYHGGQKYTTDAYTGAVVKKLCLDNAIPFQTYHNRSDIPGGSTLGNISLSNVSVPAADIGVAQLAMHSAFETTGAEDTVRMAEFMRAFYSFR